MDESEDSMRSVDVKNNDYTSNSKKPKKRSLVERELETNLTARVTSPVTTEGGVSLSRYGRARRSKNDADNVDSKKIPTLEMLKSPLSDKSPVLVTSPVYKMHASNSPIRSESPKKVIKEETFLNNQIESIYQENISLSRFGSEDVVTPAPAKKYPKVYIRKDLIQNREQEETILLIKNIFSPVKSTKKSSNHLVERSSEKYRSDSPKSMNGYVDNSSVVKTLDFDGNKKKKKENKEGKVLSKSDLFDLEAKCQYQVGDLAWARMGTYPFWPCIVTRDPCTGMFVKSKLFGRVEHDIIHVTFFGDNGRRGWIVDNMLRPFLGQLEFESTREKFTPEDKKKDPKLYAAFFVSEKKTPMWNTSIEEAETLLREPKRLRIDILYDMLQNPKPLKTTTKPPKSGKITRTDSDVSLSESLYDSLFSEEDGKVEDTDRSRSKTRNKSLDVSQVVTACLDNMAAKTGITRIQRQSHMDRWLQKAKSKTPEKVPTKNPIPQSIEKEKVNNSKKKKKVLPRKTAQKPYSLRKTLNESQNNLYPFHNEHDYSRYQNEENVAAVTNEIDLNNVEYDRYNEYASVEPGSGIGIIAKVETLCEKPETKENVEITTGIVSDEVMVTEAEKCEEQKSELNKDITDDIREEKNLDVEMDVVAPTKSSLVDLDKESKIVASVNASVLKNDIIEDISNSKIINGVNNNILDTHNSFNHDAVSDKSVNLDDSDIKIAQEASDNINNLPNGAIVADKQNLNINKIETNTNEGGPIIEDDNVNKNKDNCVFLDKPPEIVISKEIDKIISLKALDINHKIGDFFNGNDESVNSDIMTTDVTVRKSQDEDLSDTKIDDVAGPSNMSIEPVEVDKTIENSDNISVEATKKHDIDDKDRNAEDETDKNKADDKLVTSESADINKFDDSLVTPKNIDANIQQSNDFPSKTDETNDNTIDKTVNDIPPNDAYVDMGFNDDVDSLRYSIDSPLSEVLPYSPLSTCDKLDQDDIDDDIINEIDKQNNEIKDTDNNGDDQSVQSNATSNLNSTVENEIAVNGEAHIKLNGFHTETVNKYDREIDVPVTEINQISTKDLNAHNKLSLNKTKNNSKPGKKTDKTLQDPDFQNYLQMRQDAVMDEHPELDEDEIISYLFKTWLYEENTKSDAKKADDIQQSGLVKGLDNNRKPKSRKTLSITLQRIDRQYYIKKKAKEDEDSASVSSKNSEVSERQSTRLRRLRSPKDKYDNEWKKSEELISETASIDSQDSDVSMSKRFGSCYSPLESEKDVKIEDKSPIRNNEELEIASVSSEYLGTPLSKKRTRCRRLNSTIEDENDNNDNKNADTSSIKSEDSETPLTKWLKSSGKVASPFKATNLNKSKDNERDSEINSTICENSESFSVDKTHSPSAETTFSNKTARKSQDGQDVEIASIHSEESDTLFTVSKGRYKRIKFPSHIITENQDLERSIRKNNNHNRDNKTVSTASENSELNTNLPLTKLDVSEESEDRDLEDFDIPLTKRISRRKTFEPKSKAADSPENKIKVEKEADIISIASEDSDLPLSRRKQRSKHDKNHVKDVDDPEFVKYLELRQDALIDENPSLTQEDIVSYLYNTWLYEESNKSDLKKTDDIEQSNLVKGLNQDVPQPKKIRKKIKIEKEINDEKQTQIPTDKPKRKIIKPYYNEDFSDAEDEIEFFEIFKKHNKKSPSMPKPIAGSLKDVVVKQENIEINNSEVKGNVDVKVGDNLDTIEIDDDQCEIVDEVEGYFNDLTTPKPNVFKGLLRERVCEICENVGSLIKCKGCNGTFHVECVNKVVEVVDTPTPTRGRKRKKRLGRRPKGYEDDSQSDDKSQDVSDENNMSIEELTEPERYTVEADNLEAQLAVKMKEILGDVDAVNYDYYSSDDGIDWNDSVPGKCEIIDIKPKPKRTIDLTNFKCNNCQMADKPICFVCKSFISKNMVEHRQRCSVAHCYKYYHLECLDQWPQTQFNGGEPSRNNKKINEHFEAVTCPRHVCHTCVSDDPRGCKTRFSGDKLARCVRCPATYHSFTKCLPAGTQILTGSHIICPRHYEHRPGKVPCHVNTGWCFICALGGTLICCEYCPTSFHAECLNIKPPEGGYMCEDCETGRLPLYGEMVWVKLGHYRWWPGLILHPCEIPENIMAVKHGLGEFVVRFFGQYDHYWVNRGRVFPFQEGDSGRVSSQKSKIDADFTTAMEHAQRAFEILKTAQPNEEESIDIASSLLPPHYVKLKVNKPCGSLIGRKLEDPESSLTQCDCDPGTGSMTLGVNDRPGDDDPCGPYSHCLNRMLLTECGPTCRAGERCSNRAFERRLYPRLAPYRTPHRGWGLKTLEDIRAGQFVIEYVGEVLDEAEFQRRMRRKHEVRDENYYFLTLDKERMIDAGPKGNLARFMNHCCEPNCETQKWTVLGDVRVGLFALYDIPANSEVTFNYNLECAGIEKKRCLCGAKRCSGYMGAKPKQDESQPKKAKVPGKRTYKKRKNIEISPTASKSKPAKRLGRPPKPKELTEIEKDLIIIRNATTISSEEVRLSSEAENTKGLKRKLDSPTEVLENNETPLIKKQKLDEVGD